MTKEAKGSEASDWSIVYRLEQDTVEAAAVKLPRSCRVGEIGLAQL